ncbi:MAG: hypothetical protein ACRBFS_20500 [Aureispira sp.]
MCAILFIPFQLLCMLLEEALLKEILPYFNWRPFKKMKNALNGIMISPSIRYWPTISSSLEGGSFSYYNKVTEHQETHDVLEVGIANTPLMVNLSIGYSFGWPKKKIK